MRVSAWALLPVYTEHLNRKEQNRHQTQLHSYRTFNWKPQLLPHAVNKTYKTWGSQNTTNNKNKQGNWNIKTGTRATDTLAYALSKCYLAPTLRRVLSLNQLLSPSEEKIQFKVNSKWLLWLHYKGTEQLRPVVTYSLIYLLNYSLIQSIRHW